MRVIEQAAKAAAGVYRKEKLPVWDEFSDEYKQRWIAAVEAAMLVVHGNLFNREANTWMSKKYADMPDDEFIAKLKEVVNHTTFTPPLEDLAKPDLKAVVDTFIDLKPLLESAMDAPEPSIINGVKVEWVKELPIDTNHPLYDPATSSLPPDDLPEPIIVELT